MSLCSYFFITTRGNLSDPRNNLMLQCTLKYLGILLLAVYRDNEMACTYFICTKNLIHEFRLLKQYETVSFYQPFVRINLYRNSYTNYYLGLTIMKNLSFKLLSLLLLNDTVFMIMTLLFH